MPNFKSPIDMNTCKIINMEVGTNPADAVNFSQLSVEVSSRISGDTVNSTAILTEISNRISVDVVNSTSISTEVSSRISGDIVNSTFISTEISIRTSIDMVLSTAINGKEPIIAPGTINQYWRGDKTWQTLVTRSNITGCRPVYVIPQADTTIGYTTTGSATDGNNQNSIWVSSYALASTLTLESLSINFSAIAGTCRMGVYSNVGGVPTTKLAETVEFTPVVGWNTIPVVIEVSLVAGTYWLAFLGSANGLTVRCETTGGTQRQATFTYGVLPITYPTFTTTTIKPSIYASFYNPADSVLNISSGTIDIMGTGVINSVPYIIGWDHIETGMSRLVSTWYYVYADVVSNAFHSFLSTTAPTRDAFGNTISPSANQPKYHPTLTARYIGQVKTDSNRNIISFNITGNYYTYVGQGYNYILQNGTATTKTPVNCRSLVPYTSPVAIVYIDDESNTGNKYVGDVNSWMFFCTHILGGAVVNIPVTNDSIYYQATATTGISLGIHGFYESI